jgi:hypothetical protein
LPELPVEIWLLVYEIGREYKGAFRLRLLSKRMEEVSYSALGLGSLDHGRLSTFSTDQLLHSAVQIFRSDAFGKLRLRRAGSEQKVIDSFLGLNCLAQTTRIAPLVKFVPVSIPFLFTALSIVITENQV